MELLREMMADMQAANELYRPTNFWSSGLQTIVDDLEKRGFERFREHPSANIYYVPLYGFGSLSKRYERLAPFRRLISQSGGRRYIRVLDDLIGGRQEAYEDFRIFHGAYRSNGSDGLAAVSESDVGGGQRFVFDGVTVSRSFLNYLRGLAFLEKHRNPVETILEIGGGYGTLGEILLKAQPNAFYMNIDIPPVAAVSTWYLQKVFGKDQVYTYQDAKRSDHIDVDQIRARYRAAVICPWQLPQLSGSFDLFANFISFQEMEPAVVQNYASKVIPLTSRFVLLRNSVHGKQIAANEGDMGVFEQTTTDRMISYFESDFSLVARDAYSAGQAPLSGTMLSEAILMERRQ